MELAKILVINAGSSTLKLALYQGEAKQPVWHTHLNWKGDFEQTLKNSLLAIQGRQITAIGHRVVHGGETFTQTTQINTEVKKQIKKNFFLAPLHNPINLAGIEVCERLFPSIPQFAVFDTAFHTTLSEEASTYPIPYVYRQHAIRRYGFHGISYAYCAEAAAKFLGCDLHSLKLLICHLGAGASLCAIDQGKSVDTTMGMTPLEGLMMATRSGSIDPSIILYLLQEKQCTAEELENELNHASGLLGISGISGDMHEILIAAKNGNKRADLALKLFLHRLCRCMGAMIATLKGLDVVVFTAGIGENAPLIREKACASFSFLGLEIDAEKNQSPSQKEREISSLTSRIKALVIPTQEEWQIARSTRTQYLTNADNGSRIYHDPLYEGCE